jgi:hypothetical protein
MPPEGDLIDRGIDREEEGGKGIKKGGTECVGPPVEECGSRKLFGSGLDGEGTGGLLRDGA